MAQRAWRARGTSAIATNILSGGSVMIIIYRSQRFRDQTFKKIYWIQCYCNVDNFYPHFKSSLQKLSELMIESAGSLSTTE